MFYDYLMEHQFFIHIKILQGLKFMHVFFRRPIDVAVSIIGNLPSKQQTLVGEYFNVNPTSNFPMRFYIEEAKFQKKHLVLIIQLWSSQILGGDKLMKELFDNSGICGDMWDTQFIRKLDFEEFRAAAISLNQLKEWTAGNTCKACL